MINLGDDIIQLNENFVQPIIEGLEAYLVNPSSPDESSKARSYRERIILTIANNRLSNDCGLDTTLKLLQCAGEESFGATSTSKELFWILGFENNPFHEQLPLIRRAVKVAVFNLWVNRTLVYPLSMAAGWNLHGGMVAGLRSEVATFCSSFTAEAMLPAKLGSGKTLVARVNRAQIWLPITSWIDFSDINVEDLAKIRQHEREIDSCHYSLRSVKIAVQQIQKVFPSECGITSDEIDRVDKYIADPILRRQPFADFESALEERALRLSDKRHAKQVEKNERAKLDRKTHPKPTISNTIQQTSILENYDFPALISDRDGWFRDDPSLSDGKFCLSPDARVLWAISFDRLLKARKEHYETDAVMQAGLRILADYISVIIPGFLQHYIARVECTPSDIETLAKLVPQTPGDFARWPHVRNDDDAPVIGQFPTILDFIHFAPVSAATRKSRVIALGNYFEFLEDSASAVNFRGIIDNDFRTPIIKKLDSPRDRGRRKKTAKTPIDREHMPHIRGYMYAVEAFGVAAQDNPEIIRKIDSDRQVSRIVSTKDLGYVPFYRHNGINIPVNHIPTKFLRVSNGDHFLHLTAIRMFILAFEVGIRVQMQE